MTPTEDDFRAVGFTAAAKNYPLSQRAFEWVCAFNGVRPEQAPPSWRYAPNLYMQRWLECAPDPLSGPIRKLEPFMGHVIPRGDKRPRKSISPTASD